MILILQCRYLVVIQLFLKKDGYGNKVNNQKSFTFKGETKFLFRWTCKKLETTMVYYN